MENKFFLDTGGLIALTIKEEEYHVSAIMIFNKLIETGYRIFTTDYVLEEFVTWLRCKKKYQIRDIFNVLHNLYISDLNVIESDRDEFGKGLILMHKFQDHFFSMTDCISFVVMKEFKIKDCFTTDKHFSIAGFNNLLKSP